MLVVVCVKMCIASYQLYSVNILSALLVTSYCALVLREQKGWARGLLGGVTCRVTCTWWLLGLAVKAPWLGPGGPILALAAWTGLENATLTL